VDLPQPRLLGEALATVGGGSGVLRIHSFVGELTRGAPVGLRDPDLERAGTVRAPDQLAIPRESRVPVFRAIVGQAPHRGPVSQGRQSSAAPVWTFGLSSWRSGNQSSATASEIRRGFASPIPLVKKRGLTALR
jgi:hypothetical protein